MTDQTALPDLRKLYDGAMTLLAEEKDIPAVVMAFVALGASALVMAVEAQVRLVEIAEGDADAMLGDRVEEIRQAAVDEHKKAAGKREFIGQGR